MLISNIRMQIKQRWCTVRKILQSKRWNGKQCNDRQNAYIQRMHGCTAVSKGQTGGETDRKKTDKQVNLCVKKWWTGHWPVVHGGLYRQVRNSGERSLCVSNWSSCLLHQPLNNNILLQLYFVNQGQAIYQIHLMYCRLLHMAFCKWLQCHAKVQSKFWCNCF